MPTRAHSSRGRLAGMCARASRTREGVMVVLVILGRRDRAGEGRGAAGCRYARGGYAFRLRRTPPATRVRCHSPWQSFGKQFGDTAHVARIVDFPSTCCRGALRGKSAARNAWAGRVASGGLAYGMAAPISSAAGKIRRSQRLKARAQHGGPVPASASASSSPPFAACTRTTPSAHNVASKRTPCGGWKRPSPRGGPLGAAP